MKLKEINKPGMAGAAKAARMAEKVAAAAVDDSDAPIPPRYFLASQAREANGSAQIEQDLLDMILTKVRKDASSKQQATQTKISFSVADGVFFEEKDWQTGHTQVLSPNRVGEWNAEAVPSTTSVGINSRGERIGNNLQSLGYAIRWKVADELSFHYGGVNLPIHRLHELKNPPILLISWE